MSEDPLDNNDTNKAFLVPTYLQERETDRKQLEESKKIERKAQTVQEEKATWFWTETFGKLRQEILNELNQYMTSESTLNSETTKGTPYDTAKETFALCIKSTEGLTNEIINALNSKCIALQKIVSDSGLYLPTYDLRLAQNQVKELQNYISQLGSALAPKKKFAFKSKGKSKESSSSNGSIHGSDGSGTVTNSVEPALQSSKTTTTTSPFIQQTSSFSLSDIKDQTISLTESADQQDGGDMHFNDISNCNIKISRFASTCHLISLKNSTVVIGSVSGSVFVENCENCTIAVSCHQLRIHKSSGCRFFTFISGRGIIEDCNNLLFGPLVIATDSIETYQRLSTKSGLDITKPNHWYEIDDFNWLQNNKKSPNWDRFPETDLLQFSL